MYLSSGENNICQLTLGFLVICPVVHLSQHCSQHAVSHTGHFNVKQGHYVTLWSLACSSLQHNLWTRICEETSIYQELTCLFPCLMTFKIFSGLHLSRVSGNKHFQRKPWDPSEFLGQPFSHSSRKVQNRLTCCFIRILHWTHQAGKYGLNLF